MQFNANQSPHSNLQTTIINAAPPPPRKPSHLKILPKRRLTERTTINNNPQSKIQIQMDEINRLTTQLTHYEDQYNKIISSRIQQQANRKSKGGQQTINNQTLNQILSSSEQYRNQLLAAQQKRKQLDRINTAFQKQLDHISKQRNCLIAQLTNQRSKNSILDQELFMLRDSFQRYQNDSQAIKYGLVSQLNTIKTNYCSLQQQMIGLTEKAHLLQISEQKNAENSLKMQALGQQNAQIKQQLKYYIQKSNYFQNNYNVLHQNFNSLYNANNSLNKQLKQAKANIQILEVAMKGVLQQSKQTHINYENIVRQKDNLEMQLNKKINEIQSKLKEEENNNNLNTQKHISALHNFTTKSQQFEQQILKLKEQLNTKANIIQRYQQINTQRNAIIKQMQINIEHKQQFWKNTLNKEIVKLTNEFGSKIIDISTQLIKSQQHNKSLSSQLNRCNEEMLKIRQKLKETQSLLYRSQQGQKAKESEISNLKSILEVAKQKQVKDNNFIYQSESKLKSVLRLQEESIFINKLNMQQKKNTIKDLSDQIRHRDYKQAIIKKELYQSTQQIAKIKQIANLLKAQLEYYQNQTKELQHKLQEWQKKVQSLNDQNLLKQNLIAKYNCVAEDMKEQITIYQLEIVSLNNKIRYIEEQNSQIKMLNQQKQALIISQVKVIQQRSQMLAKSQKQSQKLQGIIKMLKCSYEQLALVNKLIYEKVQILNEKLKNTQQEYSNALIALNKQINCLKQQHQIEVKSIIVQFNQKLQMNKAQNEQLQSQIKCQKSAHQQTNKQKSQQNCFNLTKIKQLNQSILELTKQKADKSQQINNLIQEREQLSKIVQNKVTTIQDLKRYIVNLDQQYRTGMEGNKLSYQQKINSISKQLMKKQEGNTTLLKQKAKLEEELNKSLVLNKSLKIDLQSQRKRIQNLAQENFLLLKSLGEMQESLTQRFRKQIADLTKQKQQEISKVSKSLQNLSSVKDSQLLEIQNLKRDLRQRKGQVQDLLKVNQKLNICLNKYETQIEVLKKSSLINQAQYSKLLHISEHDKKTIADLSASLSSLQLRNVLLEEYMRRSKVQLDQISKILFQLKQQKQLLVQKYLSLTNQIYNLNHKNLDIRGQLEGFPEYFNKVSQMHVQLNQHLANINQLSQPNTIRVYSTFSYPKLDDSIIQRLEK